MTLAALEYHEMNKQVEVTLITLHTISQFFMVHAIVLEAYIHFALMYTTNHIFLVLPIKYMINEDGEPTTRYEFVTGTKPSLKHLPVLFFPCGVRKATAHVDKKAINMRHQAQKSFCGIFIEIPQHQKGCLFYAPITRKIIFPYDVVFDESFYSALAYASQPYLESMVMRPSVTYTPCATSPKGETGDIITLTHF